MKTIIAIYGPKHSGKSTVADMLVDHHGFSLFSHADPIRAALRAIGVPEKHLDRHADKNVPIPELCGKTFREAAKSLGTEWGRDMVGERIWINRLAARLQETDKDRIVIDDTRFRNESESLHQNLAYVTLITRPNLEGGDTHRSEQEWKQIQPTALSTVEDCHIRNDGNLEELEDTVEQLLYRISPEVFNGF